MLLQSQNTDKWQLNLHSALSKHQDSNSHNGINNGRKHAAECKHPPVKMAVPLIKQEVRQQDRCTGVTGDSCEVAVKAQHLYLCGRTPTTGAPDKGNNTCRHVNSCDTEHSGILGLGAVLLGLRLLTFQRILVPSSSEGQRVKEDLLLEYTTLKMKKLQPCETSGTANPATRSHIPDIPNTQQQCGVKHSAS